MKHDLIFLDSLSNPKEYGQIPNKSTVNVTEIQPTVSEPIILKGTSFTSII